jgi:hypothetical protein
VTLIVAAAAAAVLSGAATATPKPALLATVELRGGLCATGSECRFVYRITETAVIRQDGRRLRTVAPAEARRLRAAIAKMSPAEVRRHPFRGVCPTAYDGSEAVYSFRGVPGKLPSCRYDLSHVTAVELAARLVGRT